MKNILCSIVLFTQCIINANSQVSNELLIPNPYTGAFQTAYQTYPEIPSGALEAVAHSTTRFRHIDLFESEGCAGMPVPLTVMGLMPDGKGYFKNTLNTVSRISGFNKSDIINNPATAVIAYAATFHFYLDSLALLNAPIEEQVYVFKILSEIPENGNPINDYARDAQLYSILSFLNTPDFQNFYGFQSHTIDLERVFGIDNLIVLSANTVTLGNVISGGGTSYVPFSQRSPDYSPALWTPAPSCNYSSRSGTPVSAITIHTVQGSYAGAISWAQNCSSNVSYHYVIRSSDGQVTQMVYEADKAWHVGSENPYTIGYEHEGYVSDPTWYTTAMYNASASLSKDVTNSGYGINPLRTYYGASSSGTNTLGSCIRIKGHQHYPSQTHTDPGINWNWERYYKLINDNPVTTTLTTATGSFYDSGGASGNYTDDERYITVIAPTGATTVSLTFAQFDLETNWDYMYIYDGDDVNDPLIGIYTGTGSPGTVTGSTGKLAIEFRSDCATVNPGWSATFTSNSTPPPPTDNIAPTTTVSAPSTWVTQDFTATFADADNTGGSGLDKTYFSVIHYDGIDWRGNAANGFFSDNFDFSLHADWVLNTGTWATASGVLQQTDESLGNTNLYTALNQNNADGYLYHWAGNLNGTGTNRRGGLHFMVDDPTLPNRGNSYFVWFRLDNDKVQIYKVINDVFTLEADVVFDFTAAQWYDFKTLFQKSTGEINIYVDNSLVASWTDATPHVSGDYVSFRTGDALMNINNFKVFKSRSSNETVTVGTGSDLPWQNPDPLTPAGKMKSFVTDIAGNISAEAQQNINVDWTPPADVPLVADGDAADVDLFYNNTEIRANWSSSNDINSGLARYWYAIGTSAGSTDIIGWTDNWSFDTLVRNGLSLNTGVTYYVSVKTENGAGLQSNAVSSDGQLLDNPAGTPVAEYAAGNTIICAGDSISFTNSSQNATTYSWSFTGGSPAVSNLPNPKVLYTSTGNYTITLTATGPGGTDTDTQTIAVSVSQPPLAQFSPATATVSLPSAIVTFTNSSSNANAWYWQFGDGSTSTDNNPWYQYTTTGVYTVTMIALNDGCPADTATGTVTVGVTDAENQNDSFQTTVYPNPTSELLILDINLPSGALVSWKITDVSGRIVSVRQKNYLNQGNHKIQIPVNELAIGTYFIQVHVNTSLQTFQFSKK